MKEKNLENAWPCRTEGYVCQITVHFHKSEHGMALVKVEMEKGRFAL